MRVLVTGADGFVGRHVSALLTARGHDVVPMTGPTSQGPHSIDLTHQTAVYDVISHTHPDVVVHLAAQSSVARSWLEPTQTLDTNVLGSLNIWQAAQINRVPRVVYASTAEIYRPDESVGLLRESAPFGPINPYGISKLTTECLLTQLQPRADTQLAIIRPFNIIGQGQQPGFVITDVARQIASIRRGTAQSVRVGNLSPIRDFLDIRDAAAAYVKIVENSGLTGVYNLCSGVARSIQDVVMRLLQLAHLDISLIEIDPEKVRPVDTPRLVGDPSRLIEMTKWAPMISWDQTLSNIITSS